MCPAQISIIPIDMQNWTDYLIDDAPIKSIYGSDIPSLTCVSFHEIVLNRDGPAVLLRFDLHEFPSKPPQKWVKSGFNRVQVKLLATGINRLTINGLKSCMSVNVLISKEEELIRVVGSGDDFEFDLTTEFLLVNSVSAYVDGG